MVCASNTTTQSWPAAKESNLRSSQARTELAIRTPESLWQRELNKRFHVYMSTVAYNRPRRTLPSILWSSMLPSVLRVDSGPPYLLSPCDAPSQRSIESESYHKVRPVSYDAGALRLKYRVVTGTFRPDCSGIFLECSRVRQWISRREEYYYCWCC